MSLIGRKRFATLQIRTFHKSFYPQSRLSKDSNQHINRQLTMNPLTDQSLYEEIPTTRISEQPHDFNQKYLNTVIPRRSIQRTSFGRTRTSFDHRIITSPSEKSQADISEFKQQCKKIFSRKNKTSFSRSVKRNVKQFKRSQTTQDIYEEKLKNPELQELTTEYIRQSADQKQQFKEVLGHFDKKIHRATKTYFEGLDLKPKPKVTRNTIFRHLKQDRVKSNVTDDIYEFQKRLGKSKDRPQVIKEDVYFYLKESDQIKNVFKMNGEVEKFCEQLRMQELLRRKSMGKKISIRMQNQHFYRKYLKSSKQRKNTIQSSINQTGP